MQESQFIQKISQNHPDLVPIFQNNFEEGMDKLDEHLRGNIAEFLREMSHFFLKYEPGENSLYIELLKKLKNKLHSITFVTTNYDCLIELSAVKIGVEKFFYNSCLNKNNSIHILKIHGSPNFIPEMNGNQFINCTIEVKGTHLDAPCRAVDLYTAKQFLQTNDTLAPAIAMYHPKKQVRYCPEFVKFQQSEWIRSLHQAKRCIIIGLKYNSADEHIWKELEKSTCHKYYVGSFEQDLKIIKKFSHLSDTFENAFDRIIQIVTKPY